MVRSIAVAVVVGLVGIGCVDRTGAQGPNEATGADEASTGPAGTSSLDATSSEATGPQPGDETATGEAPGSSFFPAPDLGDGSGCDPYAQNCPAGQKCTWFANDGGPSWNATRCVTIVDDPLPTGASCEIEGDSPTGFDDCDLGAICLGDTCVDLCLGFESSPVCPSSGDVCQISGDGLAVCKPTCDPLARDCANETHACYPTHAGWTCAPDASGDAGAWGDACEFINGCEGGTVCLGAEHFSACAGSLGCCTALCDLDDAGADAMCAAFDPAHVCVPWYAPGSAPLGYDDVGVCAISP